jgi:hypothetical protein
MVAVVALAASFTAAPSIINIGSFDDAAFAKNGNGNGGGGGKSSSSKGKSGNAKLKGKSASTSRGKSGGGASGVERSLRKLFGKDKKVSRGGGKPASKATESIESEFATDIDPEAEVEEAETELVALRPDQKGKWNAVKANQRALEVHIRNQKFNGTIGTLAQYQLAGKAASGETLTPDEQAAYDYLTGGSMAELTDEDLLERLNSDDDTAPVYDIVDGAIECVDNCDGALSGEEAVAEATSQATAEDLLMASEQRIIDGSNKPTEGIEEQLLDELADALGFMRPDPVEELEVSSEEIVPEDETI